MYTPEEYEKISQRPIVKEMITEALNLTQKQEPNIDYLLMVKPTEKK